MATDRNMQALGDRLVRAEVLYNVSALIHTLAQREWDGSDGIDPDDLATLSYREPGVDDYRDAAQYGADYIINVTEDYWSATDADGEASEGRADSELDAWREAFEFVGADRPDGAEVYEHWIVSDWLAARLIEAGETVVRDVAGLTVWGRCTTGQAISMDGVIQRIALDIYGDDRAEG